MIPAQVENITAAWLNEKLGAEFGTVTDVSSDPIGEGVGILGEVARLRLTYGDAGGGPATLIAKCQSLHPENIGLSMAMGFYEREVNFYNQIAQQLELRVPGCHLAEMEPGGAPFVLLLEDVSDARMVDQIDGASRAECEQVIDAVAALHAAFWESAQLYQLEWLPPMNNDLYKGAQGLTEANMPAFLETWADRLPAETLAWTQSLTPLYPAMLDWFADQGNVTLAHTDCRADNFLFGGSAGADQVTAVDWQLVTRHVGVYDVANFMGMSVTIDNRRAWQDTLLRRYHDALSARGVQGYSYDRCLRDFRYCLLHQAWAQIAISNVDPGNERGRRLLDAFITRGFQAAADNNSGELLEQL